MWAILILTLPTQPNAVRLRVWRALKTLGCAALRDGAYLLPEEHAALFDPLVDEVRDARRPGLGHGACPPPTRRRGTKLRALFDRSEAYAQWRTEADALATGARRRSARPKPGAACAPSADDACSRCAASTTTPGAPPSRPKPT